MCRQRHHSDARPDTIQESTMDDVTTKEIARPKSVPLPATLEDMLARRKIAAGD
jgi:hypothetical protein